MSRPTNKTRCPHCDTVCYTSLSVQVTPTHREVTYTCQNHECGFVFLAAITPMLSLRASARPDPDINIPFSKAPGGTPVTPGRETNASGDTNAR